MTRTAINTLRALPTLAVGQAADLKVDTGLWRVWLSRCTEADGETQPIQLEALRDGRWVDETPRTTGHAAVLALEALAIARIKARLK